MKDSNFVGFLIPKQTSYGQLYHICWRHCGHCKW